MHTTEIRSEKLDEDMLTYRDYISTIGLCRGGASSDGERRICDNDFSVGV